MLMALKLVICSIFIGKEGQCVISCLPSFSLNIQNSKSVHQPCSVLSGYNMPKNPGKYSIKECSYSQRLFLEFNSEGKVPRQVISVETETEIVLYYILLHEEMKNQGK